MSGKIFVFDGCDGSGKKTQTSLLYKRLLKDGFTKVIRESFPNYTLGSAFLIKEFLDGRLFADKTSYDNIVGASMLYAINRHEAFYNPIEGEKLIDYLMDGYLIIADRYTESNMLYMSALLQTEGDFETARQFCKKLREVETGFLSIPMSDEVFMLQVDPQSSIQNFENRYRNTTQQKDILENIEIQKRVYTMMANFEKLSGTVPIYINCMNVDSTALLPVDVIHENIYSKVLGLIDKYEMRL